MMAAGWLRVPDSRSRLGRLLRAPLRLVPPTAVIPVLSGPMRGMRWIAGSTPHGAWLGTLERAALGQFVSRLRPGMTVWDIGANVGLYTLPSARAVGARGRVYAFEPMPRNLQFLHRHIALNHLGNVEVCEVAVVDRGSTLLMAEGDSPSEFHADPHGTWEVRAVALDEWLAESGASPPDLVKIDVEGSDDAVLRGGAQTLAVHRPWIHLAVHGDRQRRECARLLTGWGYRLGSLEYDKSLDASSEWFAEPV
jgi:FkbM family methyltransferase